MHKHTLQQKIHNNIFIFLVNQLTQVAPVNLPVYVCTHPNSLYM